MLINWYLQTNGNIYAGNLSNFRTIPTNIPANDYFFIKLTYDNPINAASDSFSIVGTVGIKEMWVESKSNTLNIEGVGSIQKIIEKLISLHKECNNGAL